MMVIRMLVWSMAVIRMLVWGMAVIRKLEWGMAVIGGRWYGGDQDIGMGAGINIRTLVWITW
ncbi:unnamed protein product [Staurois parvus]|uniref:Uncharacterized protein n=1 Tax=Staurois parvus TaxID=386267 RepID=A0ABN9B3G3_9NEOB|nr:unnamed protein product [Staurois parvus]